MNVVVVPGLGAIEILLRLEVCRDCMAPLGNIRRGDKTAIELFVAGIRGWEAELRRRMDDARRL